MRTTTEQNRIDFYWKCDNEGGLEGGYFGKDLSEWGIDCPELEQLWADIYPKLKRIHEIMSDWEIYEDE